MPHGPQFDFKCANLKTDNGEGAAELRLGGSFFV